MDFDKEYTEVTALTSALPPPRIDGTRPMFHRTDSSSTVDSSLSSTWNTSNQFMFLNPGQYGSLGDQLNAFNPAEQKIEALNTLLLTQLGDIVGSRDSWSLIKTGLQAALTDSNATVCALSLKIHSRLMVHISPFATKEGFTSLIQGIMSLYLDRTRAHSLPTFSSSGINFRKKLHAALVQAVNLVVDVACDLPRYWTRYPEKYIEEMISIMFDLLSFPLNSSPSKQVIYPIHILSTVSPRAKWLHNWTHGNLGRSLVFKAFLSRETLLNQLTSKLLGDLESRTVDEWTQIRSSLGSHSAATSKGKGSLGEPIILYSVFSHHLHLVCILLQYQKGYEMIPQSKSCIPRMIMFVSTMEHASTKGPAKLVAECLSRLARRSAFAKKILLETDNVNQLGSVLRKWVDVELLQCDGGGSIRNRQTRQIQSFRLSNVCMILANLLNTTEVLVKLSDQDQQPAEKYLESFRADYSRDFIDFLQSFCIMALERHQDIDPGALANILALIECISRPHIAALRPKFEKLAQTLSEVYIELDDTSRTPTNSAVNLRETSESTLSTEAALVYRVRHALLGLIDNPKGLAVLTKEGILERLFWPNTSLWTEHETFSLVTFTKSGLHILSGHEFLESRIVAMLETINLEGDNKHWRPSTKEMEWNMHETITLFASLLTNFDFMKIAVITDTDDQDDKNLLHDLIFFEESPFSNYCETESVFALKLLHCMTSTLDQLVFLETNFGIRALLREQLNREDRVCQGGGGIIVDRETLYMSHILEKTAALGGVTEHPLQELNFEEQTSWNICGSSGLKDGTIPCVQERAKHTFVQFLKKNKKSLHDYQWLDEARSEFKKLLVTSTVQVRDDLLLELFDQVFEAWNQTPDEIITSNDWVASLERRNARLELQPFEEENLAIEMVADYALRLGLVPLREEENEEGERRGHIKDQLASIFMHSKKLLKPKKKFDGIDWFSAVAFVMNGCDQSRTKSFLNKFYCCGVSPFLWPRRGTKIAQSLGKFDHELQFTYIGHHVELVLAQEVALVFSCLRGISNVCIIFLLRSVLLSQGPIALM